MYFNNLLKKYSKQFFLLDILENNFKNRLCSNLSSKKVDYFTKEKKKGPSKTFLTSKTEDYYLKRTQNIQNLKDEGKNVYIHKFNVTSTLQQFIEECKSLKNESINFDAEYNLAGRIISKREYGNKLVFYDLIDDGNIIQIVSDFMNFKNQETFINENKLIKRGDIVGCTGYASKTKSGQNSITAKKIRILSPCLRSLPNTYTGLNDKEARFRLRYLDLIMNSHIKNKFIIRSKIIKYLRKFLDDLNFLEVETPILTSSTLGATAKPFKTYFNDLDTDLFLRVAPEIFLKMLVIGGFNRIYEIGKQFRNEGTDRNHNPEFTMCEFYMAYADYYDIMEMIEKLFQFLIQNTIKNNVISFENNKESNLKIDLSKKFKKIDLMQSLEHELNIKLPDPDILDSKESNQFLIELCNKYKIKVKEPKTSAKCLEKLIDIFIEPKLVEPTFLINYPVIMSPLAKQHREFKGLTERFELFINGVEISNGYTELNDPKTQRERFSQIKNKKSDDESHLYFNELFCLALEYGLPPTGGVGIGIDRLVKLLTSASTIREIIFFPIMKSDQEEVKKILEME